MHVVQDCQSRYVCVFRTNRYIKGDSTNEMKNFWAVIVVYSILDLYQTSSFSFSAF